VKNLFQAIDNKDTETFAGFLSEHAIFRFGNAPLVEGRANIAAVVDGFFNSIKSLSHSVTETWRTPTGVICQGTVTYTRFDDSTLTIPFCNIFKVNENLIEEYLIFADVSAL
jgi:hypothetical protein